MTLRRLGPDEPSLGVHSIEGVDEHGNVLARFECPCDWCDIWRAALPMMDKAIAEMDRTIGLSNAEYGVSDLTRDA
jgi:hypothetical protein